MRLSSRFLSVLIAGLLAGTAALPAHAGLSGTKSVGPTGDYPSITSAWADLTAQGLSGSLILELQPAYTCAGETFPLTLGNVTGAGPNAGVTIRPAAGAPGLLITSANTTGTIDLNGATYVTLDGRPGGTGNAKQLTIDNSATSGFALRFINDARFNLIESITIQGANTSTSSGVVLFSTTTGANGNDSDTIDSCDLRDGVSPPTDLVYSAGSTGAQAQNNSGDTISNCNIYNFFNATSTHVGISLASGNQDWTIQGNSFYETVPRVMGGTGTLEWQAVASSSSSTNNLQIIGNYIGGSGPQCGGSPMAYSGNAVVRALRLTVGATTATGIQGNTFQNIAVASTSASSSQTLIGLITGSFNCGTVTGNVIGSQAMTGSLSFAMSNTSTAAFNAISCGTGTPGVITVANNQIGGIAVSGIAGAGAPTARGISFGGSGGTYSIANNVIGSQNVPDSFTSTAANVLDGIYGSSSGSANTVSGNVVANLSYQGTSNGNFPLIGIYTPGSSGGVYSITGNTVRNLTSSSASTGVGASASVIGIGMTAATTGGQNVSQNVIYALANTAATAATAVSGLFYSGPAAGSNVVQRNLIDSLNLSTSGLDTTPGVSQITGIHVNGGGTTYLNNMVRLGFDSFGNPLTTGYPITGVNEASGTDKFFGNSVYLGGSGVMASQATYAFQSSVTNNARAYEDNILENARSNGSSTAENYAIRYAAVDGGLTSDYNDLFASGTGGVLGGVGSGGVIADYPDLPSWRSGTGRDGNSISADPLFLNASGNANTGDLHINPAVFPASPVARTGVSLGALTNDYDGDPRGNPPDIGADEFVTYIITASAGDHGSIAPAGNVVANAGSNATFAITPDHCYAVADVQVDGSSVGAVTTYTFYDVQGNHTIAATFQPQTFTIAATAGAGGTITPSGNVPVGCGSDQSFAIAPLTGFYISDVKVDNVSQGPVTSYVFTNVQANHTISAEFATQNFILTTAVIGGGSLIIDPNLPSYPSGTQVQITANADPGWQFDHWTGDAEGSDNPLKIVMDRNKNITAVFVDVAPPQVTLTSPNGGEDWQDGTTQNITWVATDNAGVTSIDLAYSLDGGASYPYSIATGLGNTGTYAWVIPDTASTTARVQVTAHDAAGHSASDASDGNFEIDNPLSGIAQALLGSHEVLGVYPNPARGQGTHVLYRLKREGNAELDVFDAGGRLVRRLDSGSVSAGLHSLDWDGRDDAGAPLAAGIYLVRLVRDSGAPATRRFVITR